MGTLRLLNQNFVKPYKKKNDFIKRIIIDNILGTHLFRYPLINKKYSKS